MPASPWRWPSTSRAASRASSPTPSTLHHSYSMVNLQSPNSLDWNTSPPSPTPSNFTISRSATPTNPWGRSERVAMSRSNSRERVDSPQAPELSNSSLSGYHATAAYAKEYWGSLPPSETGSGTRTRSDSVSTASTVRSPSPKTPQSVTLSQLNDSLIDLAEDTSSLTIQTASPVTFETDLSFYSLPLSPQSPNDNYVRLSIPQSPPPIISQPAVSQMLSVLPNLMSKSGWERSKKQELYTWAVRNPKCAVLLLWICDDFDAWRRAVFFGIHDRMLPLQQSDLKGIASDELLAVQQQWRVMAKELPRNGEHYELLPQHAAPFEHLETLRQGLNGQSCLDRVRWIDTRNVDADGGVVARKTLTTRSHRQKVFLIQSLKAYNAIGVNELAKILVSYSQGPTVSIVTPLANTSLAAFIGVTPRSISQAQATAFPWICDLARALAALHAKDAYHGSIRPSKILIQGDRVYFAIFGLSTSSTPGQSRLSFHSVQDERYIYAAPERLHSASKPTKASDVFSLGCVFLEVLTVSLGLQSSRFSSYRASGDSKGDASFHTTLDRVATWLKQLKALCMSPDAGISNSRTMLHLAGVVEMMIQQEPGRRIKTRKLVAEIERWERERTRRRRPDTDPEIIPVGEHRTA